MSNARRNQRQKKIEHYKSINTVFNWPQVSSAISIEAKDVENQFNWSNSNRLACLVQCRISNASIEINFGIIAWNDLKQRNIHIPNNHCNALKKRKRYPLILLCVCHQWTNFIENFNSCEAMNYCGENLFKLSSGWIYFALCVVKCSV